MVKRASNESPISDVLKEIISLNKLQPGMDAVAVREAWDSLMGNGVRNYTKEVVLKGSTLYVALSSSVLREELMFGKAKIVSMINEELGREVVREVILR
ncbi:DUF721 domain-containing protein [Flavobacterium magnum]|uniref:DUF721 domain-containing protein n=1 Tax=Flavobacterium magnum TaxID=2162713 RepID=A0A2S0REC0_9FLAO|nr:DUF721 domain-containing protein [Flavobacterium magnum]AWA30026.1 DUF721 domain-containing protein [Flavobacterium magnum]